MNENKPIDIDQQATLPQGLDDTQIKDVVSHTLGIGLKGDVYDPLIEKDKYIPHKVSRKGYTTSEDNQTSIYIPVYQGDNPKASMNYHLGEAVIGGLTPAPVGTHRFEVIFALDADGIFFGEVVHLQTSERKTIKLQRGQDALIEKRRVALAEAVASGLVMMGPDSQEKTAGSSPGAAPQTVQDPVAELIRRAQAMANYLPAGEQTELNRALAQLAQARANNDQSEQSRVVLKITAILSSHTVN